VPSIQGKIEFDHKGIAAVLKNGRLVVPLNQREYSWEDEHVTVLFEDLAGALASGKTYFLGTIVLTQGGSGVPEVSDGQQRLATTTILLAAIRDWFHYHNEKEHADTIEHDYLRSFDLEEVTILPRLQLNVDDNAYFIERILANPGDPERKNARTTKASHRRIERAAEIAAQFVRTIVEPYSEPMRKKELVRWVTFLNSKAQVVVLDVPEDVDAYLMFETLNDRGLRASQADLLKNYLLSQPKADRKVEAQQKWAQMIGILESIGRGDITVTYLHHYLITRHGPTRAVEILAKVKATVAGEAQALRFLSDAAEDANDYAALFNPGHQKWNEYGTATRKHLSTINRDLRVEQIVPLMFAVARYFSVKEAQRAFQLFVYWSVRFLVAGGRGGLLDRNYAIAAQKIAAGDIKTADALTDALIDIIPSDAIFETTFSEARVSAAALARYYLRALEQKAKKQAEPEWVPSDDENAVNLEHVLPENPQSGWPHIPPETASAYFRRIGNMVLLQAKKNSIIGNAPFDQKKPIFGASEFLLTQAVAACTHWGPTEIERRQKELAKLAVQTWPMRLK